MTATRSSFSELLFPGLKRIFGDSYIQRPLEYESVFEDIESTKAWEDYQELTGLGTVPTKAEGQNTTYDTPIQGYKTTISNLTFSLGFKVTQEMYDDDQYQKINKMPKMLANSITETLNIYAANILNRSFNSSYTGGDGKELCATDHPLVGGGTLANELSTSADLSLDSFEQCLIDISNFTDGRGKKIMVKPVTLIVPRSLEREAKEILMSTQTPETANNAINVFKNEMKLVVMQYLTDPDAFFMRTDHDGLICQKRKWPPSFRQDNVFDSDVAAYKTYFRKAFGWYDPRSIFGSPGA